MLQECTLSGYNDIRKSLISEFKIPKEWIPSYYKFTHNRPQINSIILHPKSFPSCSILPSLTTTVTSEGTQYDCDDVGLSGLDIDDTIVATPQLIPSATTSSFAATATSFIGQSDTSIEDALGMINQSSGFGFYEATIDGGYEKFIQHMLHRVSMKKKEVKGNCIILNCFDGAEHKKKRENE